MENKISIKPEEIEELVRAEQRKYKAEWRSKNKDKVRESNKKYWVKRVMKRLEKEKAEGETR